MPAPSIEYTTIDDCRIAFERIGPAHPSPVIFLHGLGDSALITFRRFATHPSLQGYPALLIDLPGFGYSAAPAAWPSTTEAQAGILAALLDELGVSSAPVVAHSMGGSIAILLASNRPDLVSKLVSAEPLLRPEQSQLGLMIAKRKTKAFVERGFNMLLLATRRQAARGDLAAQGFLEPLQRADPVIMHRSAISLLQERTPSFQELLEQLTLPRTVLIGERTSLETSGIADAGVRVERIPEAGHSMMSENPAAFTGAIVRALGRASDPAAR